MSLSPISTKNSASSDTQMRGQGVWLMLAWVGWTLLTVLSLIDFVTSIQEYLVAVRTLCRSGSCVSGQPTLQTAHTLQQFGLSVGAYAALSVGLVLASGLVSLAVAVIIIWRRHRDWMALLVSSTLITQGLFESNFLDGLFDNSASAWHVAGLLLSYISPVQVLFLCALFPNGRPVPRWLGWLLLGICLVDLLPSFFPAMPFGDWIELLFILSGFPLIVGAMIYRYRRVSTPVERQQTKWVVFGVALTMSAFLIWLVPQIILFGSLSQPGSLYDLIGHPLFVVASLAIPICLGIAILRYRLWDIDVIINRTLVYGSLTVILGALYAGLIVGLEGLAGLVTGPELQQPLALVISTLVIAALFQPVRRRLQQVIDLRFYRRKYDTAKTLARFAAALRSEVQLGALTDHLLGAVDETMQPERVSLWLRTETVPAAVPPTQEVAR